MKILIIGHERDLNGASKSLLDIIGNLEKQDDIYVLTAFDYGELYDELIKHDITVLYFGHYYWDCVQRITIKNWVRKVAKWILLQNHCNRKIARKVADYCIEQGISVIHSNSSVIGIGGLVKKYSGIKHIWHIREFRDIDFQMYPLVPRVQYSNFMNAYADKFICISNAIYKHYTDLDESKKIVIYNGVDKSNYIPLKNIQNGDVINFLIAGRISEAKGQEVAIQAAIQLLSEKIDGFCLYIAGTGEYAAKIPPIAENHIKFLGMVKDMPELRKIIDIELVCSRAEAFGRVTAEAMMGGIPVIGSNTGGTIELIQDGENGFLYTYGDASGLAEKMKELIQNPKYRNHMGKKAQEYALKNFTIERCANEIKELYRTI